MSTGKPDFYEVMGLPRTATPEDIKRAYRKLALRFHPDKNRNDPQASARFQDINEAHSVLSDRAKREVYDSLGHDGLRAYEQYEQGGDGAMVVYVCAALVLLLVLSMVPLFVALRVDGHIAWSWVSTLWPIWLLAAMQVMAVLALVCSAAEGASRVLVCAAFLHHALLTVFFALVALKLDGRLAPERDWRSVFAPLFAFEVINLFAELWGMRPAVYDAKVDTQYRAYAGGYPGFILSRLLWPVARVLCEMLLIFRIEEVVRCSWFLVLLSVPVAFILHQSLSLGNQSRSLERGAAAGYIPDEDAEQERQAISSKRTGSVVAGILLVAMYFLLCLRLDGLRPYSMTIVFSPVWASFAFFFCFIPCVVGIFGRGDRAQPGGQQPGGQQPPGQQQYPGGHGAPHGRADETQDLVDDLESQRYSAARGPQDREPLLGRGGDHSKDDGDSFSHAHEHDLEHEHAHDYAPSAADTYHDDGPRDAPSVILL
jgi:hypothetical protein